MTSSNRELKSWSFGWIIEHIILVIRERRVPQLQLFAGKDLQLREIRRIEKSIRKGKCVKQRQDLNPYDPATPKLVSLIMPAYNAEQTIEKSIRSILRQSWSNFELIVVDDASRDRTLEIAQELAAEDARIRVLSNEENIGCYASRNIGLRASAGDFITIADADDISMSNRLELHMAPLIDGSAEVTISLDIRSRCTMDELDYQDEDRMLQRVTELAEKNQDGKPGDWYGKKLAFATAMYKRKIFEEIGLFWEERFGADAEFLERYLFLKHGIIFKNGSLNGYSFLLNCNPIPGSFTRIDQVTLICPSARSSNLTMLYPHRSPVREDFCDRWRLRLQGVIEYEYPGF
jgi:glycosyltransferase involved in cell wall biosynthesis